MCTCQQQPLSTLPSQTMKKLASYLFKFALPIGVLLTVITIFMGYQARNITFDYRFLDFLPAQSSARLVYEDFQNQFEGPIQNIQVALVRPAGIFDPIFLANVRALSRTFQEWDAVKKVYAITEEREWIPGRNLPIRDPWIHLNEPESWPADAERLRKAPEVSGFLVAPDLKSICIHVVPKSEAAAIEVLAQIQAALKSYNFEGVHLAGAVVGQQHFIQKMQTETLRFGIPAFILVTLLLIVLYRSGRALLFPVVIIVGTALWVLGLMALMGKSLGLLSSMLIVIFIVVGVSDAVHFFSGFREAATNGLAPPAAARLTFRKIGWATLLTSLTTAIGFLSLMLVPVPALQELGLFAGLGVFIAFFLTVAWFPLFFQNHTIKQQTRLWPHLWPQVAKKTTKFMLRKRRWFGAMPLLLVPIVLAGIQFLKTDNHFLDDLPHDDPHRADFEFFEAHYGGIRRFELLVQPPHGTDLCSFEALQNWNDLHAQICAVLPCNEIASPYTAIAHWWQKTNNTPIENANATTYEQWRQRNKAFFKSPAFAFVLNDSTGNGKLSVGLTDIGGAAMNAAIEKITQKAAWRNHPWQLIPTGLAHFIDESNVLVVRQIFGGFAVALIVVAFLMGLLFRSVKILTVALLANLLPLLIVAAIMGFAGIDLKIATAIIFSIVFGIAVDDTIHYLARYRWERNNGRSVNSSLMRTGVGTGKAIFHTTLILALGFGCLLVADFTSIFYIGLLITIALFLAFLADLLVLPIWIKWVEKDSHKKNKTLL